MAVAEKEAPMQKYTLEAAVNDPRPAPGQIVYIGIDQGLNKWVYAIRWGRRAAANARRPQRARAAASAGAAFCRPRSPDGPRGVRLRLRDQPLGAGLQGPSGPGDGGAPLDHRAEARAPGEDGPHRCAQVG